MFISYTSTTVTSQLEFSTTASCLVNLCWSYNIRVASSPLTSVSVHVNTAALRDHPSFPFHAVRRNNQWPPRTSWASAELSYTASQPQRLCSCVGQFLRWVSSQHWLSLLYIPPTHLCAYQKEKKSSKIVVGSCSGKLFIQPFPHLPSKNLSLKPSTTRIRLCGHTTPDCKPQRKPVLFLSNINKFFRNPRLLFPNHANSCTCFHGHSSKFKIGLR